MQNDTIAAVATAAGYAGIGIIRISGTQALDIACAITKQATFTHKSIAHCEFFANNNELIDSGLVLYFKSPHSFTGEDVIELQAHGSPVVLNMLLQHILTLGCRMAHAGEFSRRAYLNGKLDLVQAESISDLIHAQSEISAKSALRSLRGSFSAYIQAINQQLITLRTFVEATLDFPEEDIEFVTRGKIDVQLDKIKADLASLLRNAKQGVVLNNGANVVIIGRPNVGKSSLLNTLACEDIAIVTDIPGTTRDVIKEKISINGINLNIIDTAGIRDTNDMVEQLGIQKTKQAIINADLCLVLIDAQSGITAEDEIMLSEVPAHIPHLFVHNKIDLLPESSQISVHQDSNTLGTVPAESTLYISAKTGAGLDALKQSILSSIGVDISNADLFIARTRHLDAISRTIAHIDAGIGEWHNLEILAEELRYAHNALGEITGTFGTEELLGKIFSTFCIGK